MLLLPLLLACTGDVSDDTAASTDTTTDTLLQCGTDSPTQQPVTVNGLSFNVACQGSGTTLLMLHGFPEFWYAWRPVSDTLSAAHQVVMPDQRGYNLSDKPADVADYAIANPVADMVALIDALPDEESVVVVAHDWGGIVGWYLAALYPERVEGLVILNSPHPDVFARELAENPAQQEASSYIDFFQSEGAESALSANDFAFLASTVFNDDFSEDDRAAYLEAWGQPGAMTATLNWYRANASEKGLAKPDSPLMVTVPTLVMWGMEDTALLSGNLVGLDEYVSDLEIIEYPTATHWIMHEEPDAIAADILSFVSGL